MMTDKTIKIGGASGYWGDFNGATAQLLAGAELDYLVYDYLAEITMSIMARAREKDPQAGYATDFISAVLKQNLTEIARQKVRVIANAGGVNPLACAAAARQLIKDLGLDLKVAVVLGDDLTSQKESLSAREMFSGEPLPEANRIASINAYLGAFPIARALDEGADIVITGRCVDSAVTLGACIHEFGWHNEQWDLLAAATLAGHIIECGTQVTGGNFTDWQQVGDNFDCIGYPIAEVSADGGVTVTKPADSAGLVSVGTVCEQMLYEIGNPQAYIVPDVVCDFSAVKVMQQAPDRVTLSGARGYPATDSYKVSATFNDGWRSGALYTVYGVDADKKADRFAKTCLQRATSSLAARGMEEFTETSVEILGAESQYGSARKIDTAREVVVKIAARHPEARGIAILLKEIAGLGLSAPPGLCAFAGARPKPSPVVRLFSLLLPKDQVTIQLDFGDKKLAFKDHPGATKAASFMVPPAPLQPETKVLTNSVPLVKLAWGRSGDKGNKANIGIIARRPEYLPYIWAALDEKVVATRFAHFIDSTRANSQAVERYLMPGAHAINFLIHDVLGGGGMASLRNDAQGKGFAQLLLDQPIAVTDVIANALRETF